MFSRPEKFPAPFPLSPYLIEQRSELFIYTFLTLQAALVAYWSIRGPYRTRLANFLMVVALGSYVMMTSWSQSVWKLFHFLWNIQFPWRLNAFLIIAATGLAALAIADLLKASLRRRLIGAVVAVGLWSVVAGQSARLGNMIPAFRSAESFSFDDQMDSARAIYMQVDPNQALLVQPPDDEKIHVTPVRGSGAGSVTSVRPRSIEVAVNCETDCAFQIGQFYYPAWKIIAGPANAQLRPGYPGGLMELSLPAGEHHVSLALPHGWSERLGLGLSACCLLLVGVLAITGIPSRFVDTTEGGEE